MNRFWKVYFLLIASLLLLVSGVNGALEHFGDAASLPTFTCYDEQGRTLLTYQGDLDHCPFLMHPRATTPMFYRPLRARRA